MTVNTLKPSERPANTVRTKLALRLVHLIGMPGSQVPPSERHVIADLLQEVLADANVDLRVRCARRIADLAEPPSALVRLLASDEPQVAAPLLEESKSLSNADLVAVAQSGRLEHRRMIASRPEVSQLVAAALAAFGEPEVIEVLLRNSGARLSSATLNQIVSDSRRHPSYIAAIAVRPELRPDLALAMFWWAGAAERLALLKRFAVSRSLLQETLTDVFAMAAEDGWSDPATRRALQFVERRQRNRAAVERSEFDTLEEAVDAAERQGLSQELIDEISYLSGVKPVTGSRIFKDVGGEPIAVLCKAVGLKRAKLRTLWQESERVRGGGESGEAVLERTIMVFDSLAVDKAQTVLRYWNWSLTSAAASTLSAVSLGAPGDASGAFAAPLSEGGPISLAG